jgi:hypothetical protein
VTRVIFLAGLGRSGTTLLERALGELPAVQPLGEVVHLWRRGIVHDELCGCGAPFSRCGFWTGVGRQAFGGWDNVDIARIAAARTRADRLRRVPQLAFGARRGRSRREGALLAEHHRRLYAAAAELSGAEAVVDSSKHPSLAYCLREHGSIDLRVVHVVRDSRGVAHSWTRRVARPDARGGSQAEMTRYAAPRSALLWSLHNTAVRALAKLGTPVMLVRYESFVRRPAETVADVARFAGLAVDRADLAFVSGAEIRVGPAHTCGGNPLRFDSGPLTLRVDDAWRSRLPRRDRVAVTALSYPQLRRYGYVDAIGRARA